MLKGGQLMNRRPTLVAATMDDEQIVSIQGHQVHYF